MTRIVAGLAGGRRLVVPDGRATRPTTDRVREALFSSLQSELGSFEGLRVLDLYGGSGALGLEALSRGAAVVTVVESAPKALAVIRRNAAAVGMPGHTILPVTVDRALSVGPPDGLPYDVVLWDPPFAVTDDTLREQMSQSLAQGWVAADAVVMIERATRGGEFVWPEGLAATRSRRYGECTLWYGHRTGSGEHTDGPI